jgi:hypothetical protein
MEELVAFYKKEGRLHRRYATKVRAGCALVRTVSSPSSTRHPVRLTCSSVQILLDMYEFLRAQPTLVDVTIAEGGKVSVFICFLVSNSLLFFYVPFERVAQVAIMKA